MELSYTCITALLGETAHNYYRAVCHGAVLYELSFIGTLLYGALLH